MSNQPTEPVQLIANLPVVLRDADGNYYRPTLEYRRPFFGEFIWTQGGGVELVTGALSDEFPILRKVLDASRCGTVWRDMLPDARAEIIRLQAVNATALGVQTATWIMPRAGLGKEWYREIKPAWVYDQRYWPLDPAHPDTPPAWRPAAETPAPAPPVLDYAKDCGKAWAEFTPEQQAEVRRLQEINNSSWRHGVYDDSVWKRAYWGYDDPEARYWPLDPEHPDTPPAWRPGQTVAHHYMNECPQCGNSYPMNYQCCKNCAPRLVVVDRDATRPTPHSAPAAAADPDERRYPVELIETGDSVIVLKQGVVGGRGQLVCNATPFCGDGEGRTCIGFAYQLPGEEVLFDHPMMFAEHNGGLIEVKEAGDSIGRVILGVAVFRARRAEQELGQT